MSEKVTWGLLIVCINCASVIYAYGLGLDRMTQVAVNGVQSGEYASLLLKRCTLTQERTLRAVWEVDYRLADSIIHLPPITLVDAGGHQ